MKRFFGFLFVIVFISACGYKPSVQYTKEVLGERIHVEVAISRTNPKNSVLINDAVNEAVITRFGAKLSDKASADTNLYISIGGISLPILYDRSGFVIYYKATVSLSTRYTSKSGRSGTISTSGEYDFPIEANSVISDSKRFEAIKQASVDALNEVVSKISVIGMIDGKHN
jgi:hypothetical protein